MGGRERLDALSGEAKVWVGLSDSHEQPANLATVLRKALGGAFACSLMDRIRDPCSLLLKYTLQVMFRSASWHQETAPRPSGASSSVGIEVGTTAQCQVVWGESWDAHGDEGMPRTGGDTLTGILRMKRNLLPQGKERKRAPGRLGSRELSYFCLKEDSVADLVSNCP